jgi:uncharacterized protein
MFKISLSLFGSRRRSISVSLSLVVCILFASLSTTTAFAKALSQSDREALIKFKEEISQSQVTEIKYPLMWTFSRNGGPESYLFGTMHTPDRRWAALHPAIHAALKTSDEVYGELSLESKSTGLMMMMKYAMLPEGQTFKALVDPTLYSELEAYFKSKGTPIVAFNQMRPTFIMMMLSLLDLLPKMTQGLPVLDDLILKTAQTYQKKTGGIETSEEQAKILFSQSQDEAIRSLKSTLESLKEMQALEIDIFEIMNHLYFSGDESSLKTFFGEMLTKLPTGDQKLMDRLLKHRNQVMANRIIKKMDNQPKKRFFFAFGLAHFVGVDTVIDLLRKSNFRVKRLHAPPPASVDLNR